MTIHSQHPFADPEQDPVRRLRGRLGGAVTLWTVPGAGLTVGSLMVAAGEPAAVLGLLDPDSALAEALEVGTPVLVTVLPAGRSDLAEMFAGLFPAPGGPFAQARFVETRWGPRLEEATTWAGVRVADLRPVGWSMLVITTLEHVEVGADDTLLHRRGRYSGA